MADEEPLTFPDGLRGELDDALNVLITQAERVRGAQGRLRDLLRAVQHVVGEIELSTVLRSIAEAAVHLVQAEYGALGVIDAAGNELDQFIFVGLDEGSAHAIGHLPRGHGLLGALITEPHPIRIPEIRDDPRAAGFPAHHPPMGSFLGVPIRIRGEVFGNLYLTNRKSGQFSEEDEQLLEALASTAGFAIQNARLFEESQLRERWMSASAQLSSALLSTPLDQALDLIAGRVLGVSGAGRVMIQVPTDDGTELRVAAVRGDGEQTLLGTSVALPGTMAQQVLDSAGPHIAHAHSGESLDPARLSEEGRTGPTVTAPLRSRHRSWGVLTLARRASEPEFSEVDASVVASLASQASIALELANARTEQQRRMLSDERARIAQDLHDHVIQQLFAAGLTVQAVAGGTSETRDRERLRGAARQVDDAIGQIRTIIFALSSSQDDSVRHRLIDIVAEMSSLLDRPPTVRFGGAVDHLVEGDLAEDCVAVARELLSNSVRHSGSDDITLEVVVDQSTLTVMVQDGGAGIVSDRRSGLANLEARAQARGGTFDVVSGPDGTRVVWQAALSRAAGSGS